MAIDTVSRSSDTTDTAQEQEIFYSAKRAHIADQCRAYIDEMFREKGLESTKEASELERWIDKQGATQEGVQALQSHYENVLRTRLSSGRQLYQDFHSSMNAAVSKQWISQSSYNKWTARFKDSNVGYSLKEKWMKEELQPNMARWEKVANERKALSVHPNIKALIAEHPEFATLLDSTKFLSLHYQERVSMTAAARAKIFSVEKGQSHLYPQAQKKLAAAASAGYLAHGKIGVWLERIFKSNADPKKIDAFINGSGANTLSALMQNWQAVKRRFDIVMKKASERGENTAARGFKLVSSTQFLNMHYTQRLRYVQEAEHRLRDSKNIKEEQPIFVKIRHAMDVKDWVEASLLIAEAKTMHLKSTDWPRLKSMEQYVTQFNRKKLEKNDASNLTDAKKRIDSIIEGVSSEVQPMVLRLLRGPRGNRNIHQFRWIVYNNKWCRDNGYLDQKRARKGASKENKELTKMRAEQGIDVGRNDVLDNDTSGQQFIRKKEYANHKATLMHVNTKGGGATNTLAEWLEKEQDPKVLYWTTFCGHEDGDPKSDNWHNDLFAQLTELRGLTRTINNAGFAYDGPNRGLLGMN